eukprot:TRINITY_DN1676_c0_g1_i1.p3 TRINITY_DN1676_c0_g1~~TRINITY_DN1676_c0_g1_i1.p3  ORF type:complete len:115 (-),score=18.27 TRINITY_DN1676_c0_g1_i1:1-345(-)
MAEQYQANQLLAFSHQYMFSHVHQVVETESLKNLDQSIFSNLLVAAVEKRIDRGMVFVSSISSFHSSLCSSPHLSFHSSSLFSSLLFGSAPRRFHCPVHSLIWFWTHHVFTFGM